MYVLTTPLSGMFAIHGLAFATINLSTKFEVSISIPTTKIRKAIQKSENGVVWGS